MIIRGEQMKGLESALGDPVIDCANSRVRGRKQPSWNSEPGPSTVISEESRSKLTWIEIQMVDMESKPVPGVAYRIRLPDGSVHTGTTDVDGLAGFDQITPGSCEVQFPELDADAWKPL
jgi:hypothetical protein